MSFELLVDKAYSFFVCLFLRNRNRKSFDLAPNAEDLVLNPGLPHVWQIPSKNHHLLPPRMHVSGKLELGAGLEFKSRLSGMGTDFPIDDFITQPNTVLR